MAQELALIIEDNPSLSMLYSEALQIIGYRCETILDGGEAEQALVRISPAIILLDMNLPHISGHYLYKQLCADPRLSSVPVLIVTANAIIADALRRELRPNDQILMKPVEISQLHIAVRRARAVQP